jgi:glutamate N-acetyltransferase / amino-acid N-acetyltransferase
MNDVVPRGFRAVTGNIGLKTTDDDFMAVVSEVPARGAAILTRSRFAGPSVLLSRASASTRRSRGVVVLSGNANVATGRPGTEHATEVRQRVAELFGVPAGELMIGATGTIGRTYPMDLVRQRLARLGWPGPHADFEAAAAAMMTTDTRRKSIRLRCGEATLVGIAKGGGRVEHDSATLFAFFFTDAEVPFDELDQIFRRVVQRTFNPLNIDDDTATSDTAAIFANGLAGPVKLADFEAALEDAAVSLTRQIAAEGGASG